MSSTAPVRRVIEAEHLDFNLKANVKHEFFDGELFARFEFTSMSAPPTGS